MASTIPASTAKVTLTASSVVRTILAQNPKTKFTDLFQNVTKHIPMTRTHFRHSILHNMNARGELRTMREVIQGKPVFAYSLASSAKVAKYTKRDLAAVGIKWPLPVSSTAPTTPSPPVSTKASSS